MNSYFATFINFPISITFSVCGQVISKCNQHKSRVVFFLKQSIYSPIFSTFCRQKIFFENFLIFVEKYFFANNKILDLRKFFSIQKVEKKMQPYTLYSALVIPFSNIDLLAWSSVEQTSFSYPCCIFWSAMVMLSISPEVSVNHPCD